MGNTDEDKEDEEHPAVHPHIRGEYLIGFDSTPEQDGSSPHPWGIRQLSIKVPSLKRFIPTSVGNTTPVWGASLQLSVHPHIRGEYVEVSPILVRHRGSSPHPWGILIQGFTAWGGFGSSPHPWGIL